MYMHLVTDYCQFTSQQSGHSYHSVNCGRGNLETNMGTWFLKNSTLHKKNPPSMFIGFITKVSDIIAEANDDFSHDHFEL